jgi:hypothetical protein
MFLKITFRFIGRINFSERHYPTFSYYYFSDTSHNGELHDLYYSPYIITVVQSRRMIWAGSVARMGEMVTAHRSLMGKPERLRPLGRPRHRREDSIEEDLKEEDYKSVNCIRPAQDGVEW